MPHPGLPHPLLRLWSCAMPWTCCDSDTGMKDRETSSRREGGGALLPLPQSGRCSLTGAEQSRRSTEPPQPPGVSHPELRQALTATRPPVAENARAARGGGCLTSSWGHHNPPVYTPTRITSQLCFPAAGLLSPSQCGSPVWPESSAPSVGNGRRGREVGGRTCGCGREPSVPAPPGEPPDGGGPATATARLGHCSVHPSAPKAHWVPWEVSVWWLLSFQSMPCP